MTIRIFSNYVASIPHDQALTGSRFSIPWFFETGFILIFNPGIFRNFFRDFLGFLFLLCALVKSHNFHQSWSLSLSPPQPSSSSPLTVIIIFIIIIIGYPGCYLRCWLAELNWTTRKHFLFLPFWSRLSSRFHWQAVSASESFQMQAILSLQKELRLLQRELRDCKDKCFSFEMGFRK